MKKAELENLQVGSKIEAFKGGEYTITKIEYEAETIVKFELDNIKKVSPSTIQKNYKVIPVDIEPTETIEPKQQQFTITTVATQIIGVNDNGEMAIETIEAPTEEAIEPPTVAPTEEQPTEPINNIDELNKSILRAVELLRANPNYIVDDRKGRIAIKLPILTDKGIIKPKCIVDLIVNSRGAKIHIRNKAISDRLLTILDKENRAKSLPRHWALDLEIKLKSTEEFWEYISMATNYEQFKEA